MHEGSCEAVEGSVAGTGWRRLLQFATSDEDVGDAPLLIGTVDYTGEEGPQELDAHNLFEFSACHRHYHFKYYGDLGWTGEGGGFCLQSTARAANRETSPLFNPFGSCHYQGVAAGWVDQYKAGLPSQWVDTTTFPEGTGERSFASNSQGFLCEGTLLGADDEPLEAGEPAAWASTELIAENGEPVETHRCKLSNGWDANNADSVGETTLPHGQG